MNRLIVLPSLVTLFCAGCAGIRGAPESPFQAQVIAKPAAVKEQVDALMVANTEQSRNEAMFKLMAAVDMRYIEYRQALLSGVQKAEASSKLLQLMMSIAGQLTESVGVKNNYLAATTLLTGSQSVYSEKFLFERATPTLLMQMDAARSKVRTSVLLKANSQSLGLYPGLAALADVLAYYQAGSITGALSEGQKAAASTEKEQEDMQQKLLQQQNGLLFQGASPQSGN